MISNPSLMSHESPREYEQLVSGLMAAHEPRDGFEHLVIQHLADASWELRRVRATDSEYWEHVGGCYNRGNTGIAEALLQEKETRFRALFKMRAHAQRQYEKAMNDLYRMLDLRDRKAKSQTPAEPAEPARKRAKVAVAGRGFASSKAVSVVPIRSKQQPPARAAKPPS